MTDRYESNFRRIRDASIFILCLAGGVNEIWFQEVERPYILAFVMAGLGLPFILHADMLRRRNGNKKDDNDA